MTTNDAEMRAEFHEAVRKYLGGLAVLHLNGVYAMPEANTAWWAWREATRRAGNDNAANVELVKRLQAQVSTMQQLHDATARRAGAREAAILASMELILVGIDKDECEDETGWWETSTGAEFGARVLQQIRQLFVAPDEKGTK